MLVTHEELDRVARSGGVHYSPEGLHDFSSVGAGYTVVLPRGGAPVVIRPHEDADIQGDVVVPIPQTSRRS